MFNIFSRCLYLFLAENRSYTIFFSNYNIYFLKFARRDFDPYFCIPDGWSNNLRNCTD
uniref:Uncharacterized protein n=1 Tax=Arundo donax TaxID=35708 RepID=A0A0A8ZJ48_ARUDO